MLTLIVEIILGVFIANYKVNDHPYMTNFMKGILITIIAYIIGNVIGYIQHGKLLVFSDQVLFFLACFVIGFVSFIFFSFIDFFINNK